MFFVGQIRPLFVTRGMRGPAEQIVKFCDADPSELEELGRSAKQYAVDNFLPERVMSTLISVSGLR